MRIIAEPSANHCGDYDRAVRLIHHAKEAGADAIKFQPYESGDHGPPVSRYAGWLETGHGGP